MKLLSLTQVPVGTSLRHLKLLGFIYVPVRRRKSISNRSDLLTYQSKHRDDLSSRSRMFELVNKMGQFVLDTTSQVFRHLRCFSLIKVSASTLLQHLSGVGFIWVLVVSSLRCVKLVSLTQVSIVTLLQRLKFVGFIYVPMRCPKDIQVSFK